MPSVDELHMPLKLKRSIYHHLRVRRKYWLLKLIEIMGEKMVPYLARFNCLIDNKSSQIAFTKFNEYLGIEKNRLDFIEKLLLMGNLPKDLSEYPDKGKWDKPTDNEEEIWRQITSALSEYFDNQKLFTGCDLDYSELSILWGRRIVSQLESNGVGIEDVLIKALNKNLAKGLKEDIRQIIKFKRKQYEFNTYSRINSIVNPKAEGWGIAFSGFIDLFEEYPGLMQILVLRGSNAVSASKIFVQRLNSILRQGRALYKYRWGDIKNVEFGIGDVHHHGESATSITFYDGGRYIYKPRSLELEIELGKIQKDIVSYLKYPEFQIVPESYDFGDWGLQNFVPKSSNSIQPSSSLVKKISLTIFLLDILGFNDCHYQNLYLSDNGPCLVDGETIFHEHSCGRPRSSKYSSILGIGIFSEVPCFFSDINFQSVGHCKEFKALLLKDLSGLYTNMGLIYYISTQLNRLCRSDLERRIVFRSTSLYSLILRHLRSPSFLAYPHKVYQVLGALFEVSTCDHKHHHLRDQSLISLAETEIEQLEKAWIPLFKYQLSGKRVKSTQFRVSDLAAVNIKDRVLKRLELRKNSDFHDQMSILSFCMDFSNGYLPLEVVPESNSLTTWITQYLLSHKINFRDSVNWPAIECSLPDNSGNFTVSHESRTDIYGGAAGIAAYLKAFSLANHPSTLKDKISSCLDPIYYNCIAKLEKNLAVEPDQFVQQNIGLTGIGGDLLFISLFNENPNRSNNIYSIVERILSTLNCSTFNSKKDINVDIISGMAGLAGGLYAIAQSAGVSSSDRAWVEFWQKLAKFYISKQDFDGGWSLPGRNRSWTGFSHGSSGIICALARAWEISPSPPLINCIEKAINFELNNRSSLGEWLDRRTNNPNTVGRSWCHGSVGALLAASICRKACLSILPNLVTWHHAAWQSTVNNRPRSDVLCCGQAGWLLAVRCASHLDPEWSHSFETVNFIDSYISDLESHKRSPNMLRLGNHEYLKLDLFTGLSGIGLSLLERRKVSFIQDRIISAGFV